VLGVVGVIFFAKSWHFTSFSKCHIDFLFIYFSDKSKFILIEYLWMKRLMNGAYIKFKDLVNQITI